MAEPESDIEAQSEAPDAAYDEAAPARKRPKTLRRGWRDLWQAPALLLGVALLVTGLSTLRNTATGPDFEGALDDVETLIVRMEFDRALGLLNEQILPEIALPETPPRHKRRFHLLRGDALYLGQEQAGGDVPSNHQAVVDEYIAAEELLAELEPPRTVRIAGSLAALGRDREAVARVDSLPPEFAPSRRLILKRIVERSLAGAQLDREWTLSLLARLSSDPGLSPIDQLWTIARQAELQLASGYPGEALTHLLRAIQRVDSAHAVFSGELYLLLSEAYFDLGRFPDAERQAARAQELLPPVNPLHGDAIVLAGQIDQITGRLAEARDRFSLALAEHSGSARALDAALGLAEVQASLGDIANAVEVYADLIDRLHSAQPRARTGARATRETIADSLLERHRERVILGDIEHALKFATLAERVYAGGPVAGDALRAVATSHRLLAEEILETAQVRADPRNVLLLDPVARAQARAHYAEAGAYFLRHARQVILLDNEAFGDSLWLAGDSYDLAGDRPRAIEVFSEFVGGRPNDPRQPAALFRLGQSHQSMGDYATAARLFTDLLERNPRSPEAASAHVHLAQVYLLDSDPSTDAEAERLLRTVLDGAMLSPDAIEFRTALLEMGQMHLARGQYDRAVERLREAVARYPDDPGADFVRFQLGEALRLGAAEITDAIREGMPSGRRRELEQGRRSRLAQALDLYDQVRRNLEQQDPNRLNELERLSLRNSYFYRADCAFDLEDYDAAIRHYDAAAQRFIDDPASLVAMMQIVNCYIAMERWPEARTANERARRRLSELPDSLLDSPELPLDRRHWERWLESSERLTQRAAAEG